MALPSAHALVRWNDSREQIFLNLEANAAWESNIFASAGGDGDVTTGFTAGLDYQRRAGLIGVNASMSLASVQFAKYSEENYLNPNLTLELNKDSGRTTGSLSLSGVRESRADPAANVRTEAWNYNTGLNLKYPVIERYSLAGSVGYSLRDFDDNSFLVDLSSYTASIDLFYVYTSERDLVGGYRLRQSESSTGVQFFDHSLTAGITGKIFPKISGSVRAGYQFRTTKEIPGTVEQADHSSWTLSASTTWTVSQRLSVTSQLSKDFSVTSTDVSVDAFSASLNLQLALSGKMTIFGGIDYTSSDYLGEVGGNRHDTMLGFSGGIGRTIGSRIKANVSYSYSQNWSTVELSDFERQSVSLNLSTRL
ncbi:MAG TPA: outer membrane beta-barrel protein [Opitutaceae bacterium]